DPQKIASRNMTALDVADAVRRQNVEAALGQVGQPPMGRTQAFQLPLDTLGRLRDPVQFGDIIVKARQARPVPPAARGSAPSPNAALPGSGVTDPPLLAARPGGASPSAPTAGAGATGLGIPMTTDLSPPSTGTTTTTTTTITAPTTGNPMTGGGTAGGGASAGGGGTTTGGAASAGGGTTGRTAQNSGMMTLPQSSLTAGGADHGAISATTQGRGPPPPAPAVVRLRDVARVERGALNYNQACYFDGKPAVGLTVYQLPGTNALDVADGVRARMAQLSKRFPEGVA